MTHRAPHSQSLLAAAVLGALCWACLQPATASAQAVLDEANTIAAKVGTIRGLAPKGVITNGFKSRDELRKVVESKLAEQYTAERIRDDGDMLIRLGLLEPGTDYGKLIVELLTEQIAGFYDHEKDELYLIEGGDPATQRITIAHEIFHGIQDQHFDLETVQPPKGGPAGRDRNDDYSLATSALIEGDATILMFDFTYLEQGVLQPGTSLVDTPMFNSLVRPMMENMDPAALGQSPALASAPPWIAQLLVFPYLRGMGFVAALREPGSWARADRAYREPPKSTEHILHPEKYLAGEEPVLVVVDSQPVAAALHHTTSEAWEPMYDNVMGELQLGLWLQTLGVDKKSAQGAAAGWGGDRLLGYRNADGDIIGVLVSAWDTEADADEFAGTLGRAMALQNDDLKATLKKGTHGQFVCASSGGERVTIERWGSWVIWTSGLPEAAPFRPVREAIWEHRQIGTYADGVEPE